MTNKEKMLDALETIGEFCTFEDCNKCFLNAANLFDNRINRCTLKTLYITQYSLVAQVARESMKKGTQEDTSEHPDDWDD